MRHLRFISIASILGAICIAGLTPRSASSSVMLTVTNPGFVASVNNTFTYNPGSGNVTYNPGDQLPLGLYVNSLTNGPSSSTGNVRRISDDSPVLDNSSANVTATINGWTATLPHAGVANFAGLGDIANLVTLNENNVGFDQTLPGSVQLTPNTTYILSMTIRRLTIPLSQTFTADLTVGGTPVGGTLVYSPPPNDATPGSAVVTYVTGASPLAGNLGIQMRASSFGPIAKVLVDDVVLQAPEPASIGLLALSALPLLRRRSR